MADVPEGLLYAANNDVMAVEALARANVETHSEVIAFHCQQAAEKMVKNVFNEQGEIAPKIHAVDELLERPISRGWLSDVPDAIKEAASRLSHFAVANRYAETPDIGKGEALSAIADCNAIADMLERNGYDALRIDFPADYLNKTHSD